MSIGDTLLTVNHTESYVKRPYWFNPRYSILYDVSSIYTDKP